jgi:uncharacterized LabA/DUF88 family protein
LPGAKGQLRNVTLQQDRAFYRWRQSLCDDESARLRKATKECIDALGRRKVKGSMDIELAVDAMELTKQIDEMVG